MTADRAAPSISTPGIFDLDVATYHADPVVIPSLSAGIAWEILARSPLHAWWKHPRLNPDFAADADKKFDLGTVAHTLIVRKGNHIVTIDAQDYRTADARGQRELALAKGLTPILREQYDRAAAMAEAATRQLRRHELGDVFSQDGIAEPSVIWRDEGDIWCRCRPDWLIAKRGAGIDGEWRDVVVYDLKTTANAHPNVWRSRVEQIGFCFKAAFYARGLQQVTGCDRITYRWVVIEVEPPHALAVYESDPADLTAAEEDVSNVIAAWGECLKTNVWPAYPPKTMMLPLSGGYRMRQEARQEAGELSPEAIQQAIRWTKEMLAS